jgi:hypothetical protein
MEPFNQVLNDIFARIDTLRHDVSEERIRQIVANFLDGQTAESMPKIVRHNDLSHRLSGSKFARWDLSLADIEFLYDLLDAARRAGLSSGPSEALQNAFADLSRAYYLPQEKVREMDRRAIDNVFPRIPLHWYPPHDRALAARGEWHRTTAYEAAVRAMDTTESGFGQQLVGTQYVRELWDAARSVGRVFPMIEAFEMLDPTVFVPVEADLPELYFVSESTTTGASAYPGTKTGSQRVQLNAKKLVIRQLWSGELEEDSIIPFVPFIRRQTLQALAYYLDSLILNGDTTDAPTGNINSDDGDPDDNKHYLAFDGLRHVGLVDNTANSMDVAGGITYQHLSKARSLLVDRTYLHDWGHPVAPEDLVYLADPETADAIGSLPEVITFRQYQGVPLLNGEIGRILGHPVVATMAMPKTKANGRVSVVAANNVKGQVVVFNRRGCLIGWRRRVRVDAERYPATDQTSIIYSLRIAFGRYSPSGNPAGIEAAATLYNITL